MTASPASAVALATRNRGKLRELAGLLAPFALTVLGPEDFPHIGDIEETGATFAENALLKARAVSLGTGLVALADDSGLVVDALDGRPGVHSARYSEAPGRPATDERNVRKLLDALKGVPWPERTGRFCCCMAACTPAGESLTATGAWEGVIALAPAGSGGFGYDPVFFDPGLGRTAAEMSPEEKNRRSHRAAAVAALLREWPAFWQRWLEQR